MASSWTMFSWIEHIQERHLEIIITYIDTYIYIHTNKLIMKYYTKNKHFAAKIDNNEKIIPSVEKRYRYSQTCQYFLLTKITEAIDSRIEISPGPCEAATKPPRRV